MKRILILVIIFIGCNTPKNATETISQTQSIPVLYKDSLIYIEVDCPEKTRQQIRQEEQTKRKSAEEETKQIKIEAAAELKRQQEATKQAKQEAQLQLKMMDKELKELKALQKHDERIFKLKNDSLEAVNKTLLKQISENGKIERQKSTDNRKSHQTETRQQGKSKFWIGFWIGISSLLVLYLLFVFFISKYLPKSRF